MLGFQEILAIFFFLFVLFGVFLILYSNKCRCDNVPSRLMVQLAIISGNRHSRLTRSSNSWQMFSWSERDRPISGAFDIRSSSSTCRHGYPLEFNNPGFRTTNLAPHEKPPSYEECCSIELTQISGIPAGHLIPETNNSTNNAGMAEASL